MNKRNGWAALLWTQEEMDEEVRFLNWCEASMFPAAVEFWLGVIFAEVRRR